MEDGPRTSGFSNGLAFLLGGDSRKESMQKTHFVSCCDEIGDQSMERALEHIFDLPHKSIQPSKKPLDVNFIRSILRNQKTKFQMDSGCSYGHGRDAMTVMGSSPTSNSVVLDKVSICGELKILREPLLVQSFALFSSARANTCVWKGKWMYEVILETCGIQQLGWTTLTCPFTEHKGVGDGEDSYAFDGRRVSKWNKDARAYGQPWVVGDVIGCCIDLESREISFYRNGISLGVAYEGIRVNGIGVVGYFPAVSLSEGERCYLNFGDRPLRYPVEGFSPLQSPPALNNFAAYLLECLSRLLDVQSLDGTSSTSFQKLRMLKRFTPPEEILCLISHGICQEFLLTINEMKGSKEYIAWGPFLSFLLQTFRKQEPHDYRRVDQVVNLFLQYPDSCTLFQDVVVALSNGCRSAPLVLLDCPFTGSYPYLALACHILKQEDLITFWWKSPDFEYSFEGFLSMKGPNKLDLQSLFPSVWCSGYFEDLSSESSMTLATTALSGAISKIEELHRELCHLVIQFVPRSPNCQSRGSVFRTFVQNIILRTQDSGHKMSSSGGDSAVVSLYMVILHFLSEGFAVENPFQATGADAGGFLHKGGKRNFPIALLTNHQGIDFPRLGGPSHHLLNFHPLPDGKTEEIQWNEGCMEDEETRITHSTRQKPCCCSSYDIGFTNTSKDPAKYTVKVCKGPCTPISDRPDHGSAECSGRSLDNEMVDKPGSSDQSETDFGYRLSQNLENVLRTTNISSDVLREEELLDTMLLLYHIGVTPNFKMASYYMSHQSQSISLLDETDRQIREKTSSEELKRLKETRNVYHDELVDSVRQSSWYRIYLCSHWKQRGMYASCMWIADLLLVLSNDDSLFIYIPEFYVEALVDCFHALRRCDPPFVSSSSLISQGLASFVTFIVMHFDDLRIANADLRDLLLQSISVLVQYKDFMIAFEKNKEAVRRMPRSLLLAFDNRSWILVANILLRLCKGSGFGTSKHGESSSSALFQSLLRDVCVQDETLFSCFLNRLFNTLSWTMTEFSVSIREMREADQDGSYYLWISPHGESNVEMESQELYVLEDIDHSQGEEIENSVHSDFSTYDEIPELQQRKSSVIFDLSCSLARILEFCTREIPQAFLSGSDMNLQRLTELVVFILNHIISAVDSDFFDMSSRRHGQNQEKTNRALILAPLVGIILNVVDATTGSIQGEQNDFIEIFASMDCPTIHCGFQYLLGYNWGSILRGDACLARLSQLERFLGCLLSRVESGEGRGWSTHDGKKEGDNESCCCICYACDSDVQFEPCHHTSCSRCITRHLLNSQRCFFCNAIITEVVRIDSKFLDLEGRT